jgi:hypothetical protein
MNAEEDRELMGRSPRGRWDPIGCIREVGMDLGGGPWSRAVAKYTVGTNLKSKNVERESRHARAIPGSARYKKESHRKPVTFLRILVI